MSTPVVRRRKRAIEVDTIQWTGENAADVQAFTGPGNFRAISADERTATPEITASVYDTLHHSWIGMYTGWHVVRGGRGECHPIADDVLAETYEEPDATPAGVPAGLPDVVYAAVSTFQVDRLKPGGYDQQLTAHVVAALTEWGEGR